MERKKLVILFSGNGTNLENIIKKLHNKRFRNYKIEVVGAISNRREAYGIERAKKYNIPVEIIEHKNYNSREEFDLELVKKIKEFNPDLTILAGFMRILTPIFTDNIKAVNIHPSLLPLYKGNNAMEKSYHSPMKIAGVTVHYVSKELDGGEIIDQMAIEKRENETFEEFSKRMHEIEYQLYPRAILKVL